MQSLACVDAWEIDPEIVNTHGGAIAIGHPLGASGGRILGTLAQRAARVAASAGASPRSASASARASPSCWRTSEQIGVRTAFLDTADEAVADIADGSTVLIGGFGLAGSRSR